MALILDTNAFSAFVDGVPEAVEIVSREDTLSISTIVLGEFLFGILQSRRRAEYELWLDDAQSDLRVLRMNHVTAKHYADIRLELKKLGRPIPSNDVWIAATAREHGAALMTRDAHFRTIPKLTIVSW